MDPSKLASAASSGTGSVGNMPNIGTPKTPTTGVSGASGNTGTTGTATPGAPNNQQTPSNGNNNSNKTPNAGGEKDLESSNNDLGEALEDGEMGAEEGAQDSVPPEDEGPKPGDKAGTGKQVGEDGQIEDSSTKKTVKAIGRGAAAYFTGGESIGKDQQIANMKPVDDAIGVVSDQLDKVPGVEQISKELDEAGLADGVNDVLDTVGNAKNGDIQGTIESGKKALKDVDKAQKYATKKVLMILAPIAAFLLFIVLIFGVVLAPVIGGFLDVVESVDGFISDVGEAIADTFVFDNASLEAAADLIAEIEGFENLSEERQRIVTAAATAVAEKVKYSYGSHPHGPGLTGIPSDGLDCAGFVQWALWTGLGGNPGYLTTQVISDKIGTDFIEISKSELQPGDIGLKRLGGSEGENYNHTGIYVGNDQWIHASTSKTGVIRGSYNDFTIFLRYKGVN